ncbi:MAG: phosphopantetheine-binding protein [Coxiellaceae bacterium]|jgi:acyl carrier protein|nr:phosphopantetheine-binding protein [Coxiellaceae bacterium]
MKAKDILDKTKNFLQRYIGDRDLGLDEDIFSSGLVNSLFSMQLVLFIEKEFQFKIENKDLDLKNFRTLNSIADFILSKKAIV